MFKRRERRTFRQSVGNLVYPAGGWRRAGTYMLHRLRRLPDQPQRIGRGVGVGIFSSFTPFFGIHFIFASAVAWLIRGNIFAALLGTFACNPVTVPFIAIGSVTLGRALMGFDAGLAPQLIFVEFGQASAELWHNVGAIWGPEVAEWAHLMDFTRDVFLPYLLGGVILGLIAGAIAHYLTVPLIQAYHRRRARKMADRIARAERGAARLRR